MIKFEEHDGKLFRMLDEPTPLTPDAEMPCLVRLIQDDSPMGRNNKNSFISCLHTLYVIDSFVGNKNVVIENGLIVAHHSRFEIIGTFAEEGSKDWALHQMMQGEKVFRVEWECDMYCQYTNNEIITFRYGISSAINPVEEWIASAKRADFGWQIYETVYGIMERQIVRKLSPADIVIRIGCLSGTVRPASTNGIHIWFHLIGVDDKTIATICISSLDTQTRELVESLIKGQEESND